MPDTHRHRSSQKYTNLNALFLHSPKLETTQMSISGRTDSVALIQQNTTQQRERRPYCHHDHTGECHSANETNQTQSCSLMASASSSTLAKLTRMLEVRVVGMLQ